MPKDSEPLTCPALATAPQVRHGFFTRKGGVSGGIYASLNCGPGSGDDIEAVMKNRARVANTLGQPPQALITCYQVHSADVVTVATPWQIKEAPEADAMVTNTPNVALGILTADCLPVLFADTKHRVIAAAHAGWKGAFSGVLENTLAAMEKLGADKKTIAAAIGPGIAQKSYEVGAEFYERFLDATAANARYFVPSRRKGHHLFDLKAYAHDRLRAAGVSAINLLERDTCLEEDAFFSFRRATLRQEPSYGRQISVITLEATQ